MRISAKQGLGCASCARYMYIRWFQVIFVQTAALGALIVALGDLSCPVANRWRQNGRALGTGTSCFRIPRA